MEKLYLGVAREIITPEVGGRLYGYRPDIYSECVNDDLTATAFYFKQGDTRALMVSLTVVSIGKAVVDRLLPEIEARFGIAETCAMLSAIHTHSGPCIQGRAFPLYLNLLLTQNLRQKIRTGFFRPQF